MKKVLSLIAVAALVLSCGGNAKKGGNDAPADDAGSAGVAKAESVAAISIGDKFAFAGLQSDQLVPDFALELAELATSPRSESNPMKDEAFFYTGPDITAIPAAKVQAYLQKVYAAVKKAADGGVVYYQKGTFDNQRGEEATEAPTAEKPAASVMYLYQHDGTWFYISAGHKAYFRKFAKDYGEKFIGAGVLVKEIIGEVE